MNNQSRSSMMKLKVFLILFLFSAFITGVFASGCSGGPFGQDDTIVQSTQNNNIYQGTIQPAEPVFFVHISDTHIGIESGEELMRNLFTEVLPVINPLTAIHTGDMVNAGFDILAWQTYQSLLANIGSQQYVDMIGNHDVKELIWQGKTEFKKYSETGSNGGGLFGITRLVSINKQPVCLIRTDTADSPTNNNTENINGYFPETQQVALLNDPGFSPGPSVLNIVLGHNPVKEDVTGDALPQISRPNTPPKGNDLMKELITKAGAPIYLCGHVHAPALKWVGKTLVVQADTFGKHGTSSTFYLVAYDAGYAAAKLVNINSKNSPSIKWPVVFITAPVNNALGGGNPNQKTYKADEPGPTLRAMVFSKETASSVECRIGENGSWNALKNSGGRLWESALPVKDLTAGSHVVYVHATSGGITSEDTISVTIN